MTKPEFLKLIDCCLQDLRRLHKIDDENVAIDENCKDGEKVCCQTCDRVWTYNSATIDNGLSKSMWTCQG